jgi:3D-(3,5/4)-trihydroxycyclohexane-1,2-dione acylhydrolase (decyclizing)
MKTIRLTMAQAVVRFLAAQRSEIDGKEVPLVAGTFAIFGHGNVAGMGEALAAAEDVLPTYRSPMPRRRTASSSWPAPPRSAPAPPTW